MEAVAPYRPLAEGPPCWLLAFANAPPLVALQLRAKLLICVVATLKYTALWWPLRMVMSPTWLQE